MTDRPPAQPTRHHAWRITKNARCQKLGRLDLLESAQAGSGRCFPCPRCSWDAGQPRLHRPPLFGPDTLPTIQQQLLSTSNSFFSKNIVAEIIEPTVHDIVQGARGRGWSRWGFVISLWAGSSAIRPSSTRWWKHTIRLHCATPFGSGSSPWGSGVVMLVIGDRSGAIRGPRPRAIVQATSPRVGQYPRFGYYPMLALWAWPGGGQ